MAVAFDRSDVPLVDATQMSVALGAVVESGHARVFFEGAGQSERDAVEAMYWELFEGEAALGGTVLLRLWNLVDALQSRRLKGLLMDRGFGLLQSAFAAAGGMRLNLDWGFVPQRLIWAIEEAEAARAAQEPATIRLAPSQLPQVSLAA